MIGKSELLTALQRHIGAESGVSAAVLALDLHISEREVRHLITELREEGIAICGHPSAGYFIAASAEELQSTCAFLRSRAMHSLTLESKLRKIPLPELLGQLRLKT